MSDVTKVRCKVMCQSITESASYQGLNRPKVEVNTVTLVAASGEVNKAWSKWTPFAEFKMTINNPEALAAFKVGEFYFVDFTPAPFDDDLKREV